MQCFNKYKIQNARAFVNKSLYYGNTVYVTLTVNCHKKYKQNFNLKIYLFLFIFINCFTMKILEKLRKLDAYPKTLEDFSIKTPSGAAGLYTY